MEEGQPRKRTWLEIKQGVRAATAHFLRMSFKVPSSFTFEKLPGDKMRVYFLASPAPGRETTLLFTDVGPQQYFSSSSPILNVQPVLSASFQAQSGKYSREELQMMDRKRVVTWGITSYEADLKSRQFMFPAAGSLFLASFPPITPVQEDECVYF
ncbi:unnamed protein product [Darwinula stevensoni]|uniref:Uncharacterized protein n=1 Tax=Darwinula stevensoni TaxID=69355 RepID=A0A7R9ACH7_9CRUS|nr:unnamed protein product [Darwinula stevensoni]CAG0900198.1 unnamed protein product [Darwinula stevensoni]